MAGAGTAENHAQIALTNGIIMTKMYYDDSPYQDPGMYLDILPVYRAGDVRTPLLLIDGTADQAVGPAGVMCTYRTYVEESGAPVRYIRFPGEGHHPAQYVHQYRKVQRSSAGWRNTSSHNYIFFCGPEKNGLHIFTWYVFLWSLGGKYPWFFACNTTPSMPVR